MNLIPWRSRSERTNGGHAAETGLARLRGEMDNLFETFFRNPFDLSMPFTGKLGPRLDLAESEDEVVIKAELPGVDPKDVDIHVAGNVLTIRGEKKEDREERGKDFRFVERQYGSFHRSVPLPSSVDPDRVTADYRNGVLTVTLAKRAGAKPKRIAVRGA